MPDINTPVLAAALLIFAGVVLGAVSARAGVSFLVAFLAVGMLAGEDGPGGILFDDIKLSYTVGNIALAVILLDGGLRTRVATFRTVGGPAIVLATAGVALSAAFLAVIAMLVAGLDWPVALLLGSIVGSTDAAAVFALLRAGGVRLNERVGGTLELESGLNDPMAVFLVISLIEWIRAPADSGATTVIMMLVQQLGIGAVGGLVLGFVFAALLRRVQVSGGLAGLLITAAGLIIFAATGAAGGSGFLAVYVAGMVITHRGGAHDDSLRATDGYAWLAQATMFLILGLLVTPHELLDNLPAALLLGCALMLVARPLAVALCLAPFRFPKREVGFIAWVGLRGAVPIVLALFPLLAGLPDAALLFDIAFVVVLLSLLAQGVSLAPLAHRLGVALPQQAAAASEASVAGGKAQWLEFRVAKNDALAGVRIDQIELPPGVVAAGIVRGEAALEAAAAGRLQAGDSACFITSPDGRIALLEQLRPGRAELKAQAAFGAFLIAGDAGIDEVASVYGAAVPPGYAGLSLAQAIARGAPKVVAGDRITLGELHIVVAETAPDGHAVRVGIRLDDEAAS